MATFVGYKKKGFFGSVLATIGVALPSLIIIFLISLFFDAFMQNQIIQYAFTGIKCGVAILITKTGIDMFIKCKKNIVNIVLFSLTFITMIVIDLWAISFSAIVLLLIGGVTGIVVYTIYRKILSSKEVADIVMEDSNESVIEDNEALEIVEETKTAATIEDTTTKKAKPIKKKTTTKKTTSAKKTSTTKKSTAKKTSAKTSTKSKKQEEVK